MPTKTLDEFIANVERRVKGKRKTTVDTVVVESDSSSNSTVKIPLSERKESPIFYTPLAAPKVEEDFSFSETTFNCYLSAFLSKNPHYKYLYFTQSRYCKGKQFWFLDTKRNVTIILSQRELTIKIKLPHSKG